MRTLPFRPSVRWKQCEKWREKKKDISAHKDLRAKRASRDITNAPFRKSQILCETRRF